MTLNQVSVLTEEEARETLERIRWPKGPVCPDCGAVGDTAKKLGRGKKGSHRAGLYECHACKRTEVAENGKRKVLVKQFTVTVGTIFEDSHIPLRKWLMAFALICSAKKGISALQLQRELEFGSYRTAWFMAMRIREAMKREPLAGLLGGTVEVDETYVGGKARPQASASKANAKRGRGTKKTPVVALVERDGRVRARKIERVDAATLKGAVRENVDRKARLMTDEFRSYHGLGKEFAGGHEVVRHSAGEYARGDAHTNTVESFFALLKRGVVGSFHHISKEHLDRYCDEFSFRWDFRRITDAERTQIAIERAEGRRLFYKEPIRR